MVRRMSQANPVRLFVTHCFDENDDYHRVFEFLESATNFFYKNCSDPNAIPAAGGTEAFKDVLRKQIEQAEAVLVLESVYQRNRDLLVFQLNAAQAMEKPIIAMELFGQVADISDEISKRADAVAPWNERMMVDIILREARHESTNRWDVIEFEL
jgi:Thoeris protein ThsB, TIR-like domain